VNKIIHKPTSVLKTADEDKELIVDTVKRLFNLEGDKNDE
jgi:glutamyl-tRNA reductase